MGDYRILTLTDPIYRAWAKTRCRELDPLFKFWGGEGLLSAAPGYGAADGHYDLALRIEQALVRLWPFGGGATDLSQCFDRILRQQVYPLAIHAGIPHKLILAYAAHAENIKYVNCYPTGYGGIRRRTAGIAQGCPFSMRFLSICLCPWAQAAKLAGTIPRVLADDLMVFVTGEDAHIKTARALILAHEFILDLRGEVKVEKT